MTANDNHSPERWRPIPGFEGLYEVSDHGRVRSVDRVHSYDRTCRDGRTVTVERTHKGRLLRPGTVTSGHQLVVLGRGNSRLVHALVLTAFVGPRPDGHDSCHIDGDPAHNHLTNLRWGTRSENMQDAIRHGTFRGGNGRVGEAHHKARLTEDQVREIRSSAANVPSRVLAASYGVSRSAIKSIRAGKTWTHVTGEAA